MRASALIGLLALTTGLYAPIWSAGYVYEDRQTLSLSGQALNDPLQHTIPSRWLSAWSVWLIAKIDPSPRLQHAVNLALHLGNVCLVFGLAEQILASSWWALVVATIFAVHPIQTETVAYITARTDLLSTLCLLAAAWAVSLRRYVHGAAALLMGLAAKESAVVGLGLLPLMHVGLGRSVSRWLVLSVLGAWVGLVVLALGRGLWSDPSLWSQTPQVWLPFLSFWRLIGLFLVPIGLSVEHDYSMVSTGVGCLAGVATGVIAVVSWKIWRLTPIVGFGLAWTLIALGPRFVLRLPEPISEHQFYLASVGMAFVLAEGVRFGLEPRHAHV